MKLLLFLCVFPFYVYGQSIDTSQYSILRYDSLSEFYFNNEIFPKHSKITSLDKIEIEEIENLLKNCFDEYNTKKEIEYKEYLKLDSTLSKDRFLIKLSSYYRQYVPVLTDKKEKLVYVNCFCSLDDEWRKVLVTAHDLGKCYFQVKINITKSKYYDLFVQENHP